MACLLHAKKKHLKGKNQTILCNMHPRNKKILSVIQYSKRKRNSYNVESRVSNNYSQKLTMPEKRLPYSFMLFQNGSDPALFNLQRRGELFDKGPFLWNLIFQQETGISSKAFPPKGSLYHHFLLIMHLKILTLSGGTQHCIWQVRFSHALLSTTSIDLINSSHYFCALLSSQLAPSSSS